MKSRFACVSAIVFGAIVLSVVTTTSPAVSQALGNVSREAEGERLVARVDPNRPIQIKVVNAGGATVTCALTQPASAERTLKPGESTTFGSTASACLPLPINFLVYPGDTLIGLSSSVFAEGNVVTIVVSQQLSEASGDIAVSINTDGSVYLY